MPVPRSLEMRANFFFSRIDVPSKLRWRFCDAVWQIEAEGRWLAISFTMKA